MELFLNFNILKFVIISLVALLTAQVHSQVPMANSTKTDEIVNAYEFHSPSENLNNQFDEPIGKYFVQVSQAELEIDKDVLLKLEKDPTYMFTQSKFYENLGCQKNICQLSSVSDDVNVTFKTHIESLKSTDFRISAHLDNLKNANDKIILLAYGFSWSNIFQETKTVLVFENKGRKTLVSSIFVGAIKKKTISKVAAMNFFMKIIDLDKKIKNRIDEDFNNLKKWLLEESKKRRSPASDSQNKDEMFYDTYAQNEYSLIDPEGDAQLIRRILRAQDKIINLFIPVKVAPLAPTAVPEWETHDPLGDKVKFRLSNTDEVSLQGREKPIDMKKLFETLKVVMKEEYISSGIRPHHSSPHRWSDEYKAANQNNPYLQFSKALVALSAGLTYRFMYTGQERNLFNWIIDQDVNSITLHEMYRTSYRLNKGDIYLTILTIENLLAARWRLDYRESLPVTKRLLPITSGYNYDADRFGTWYHLWGMILYGYLKGATKSYMVGVIEAIGSNIMSSVDKTQKQWMNKTGGDLGDLLKTVDPDLIVNTAIDKSKLKDSFYRIQNEDFRDRLPFNEIGELKADLIIREINIEAIWLKSNEDLNQCHIDIIPEVDYSFNSRNKISFDHVNLPANKTIRLGINGSRWSSARVFVKCKDGAQVEFKAMALP